MRRILLLSLLLAGCAGTRPSPPLPPPPPEECVVRLFAVGDLTVTGDLALDTARFYAERGCCVLFLEFPPVKPRDPALPPAVDPADLIAGLRERTGIAAVDVRGYVVEMQGPTMVLVVAPLPVMAIVEEALAALRAAP